MSSIPTPAMPHAKAEEHPVATRRRTPLAAVLRVATAPALIGLGASAIALGHLRRQLFRGAQSLHG